MSIDVKYRTTTTAIDGRDGRAHMPGRYSARFA